MPVGESSYPTGTACDLQLPLVSLSNLLQVVSQLLLRSPRTMCCMPWGDMELPSPGYDSLQLGHTNCLNHINTPSQQVQKSLLSSLTWKLLKPMTVFPLQQWPLSNSKHQFIISPYHRINHLVSWFPVHLGEQSRAGQQNRLTWNFANSWWNSK